MQRHRPNRLHPDAAQVDSLVPQPPLARWARYAMGVRGEESQLCAGPYNFRKTTWPWRTTIAFAVPTMDDLEMGPKSRESQATER